ncbi:glycosyltransferase family protein [Sporosarcina sp. FSL K6-1522]|uniref:glycosyltransferase family protein n=1 Tax=Sporosarcina sp. FSL K6-1522 TaxID=2921554 RepID=UPI00315A7993
MKVVGIIQARMGSSRLPNKVLLPLGSNALLDYAYQRAKNVSLIDEVIVATSTNSRDDAIEQWAVENNGIVFRGSENDLLLRFADCAKKYNADYIVRITGDCPFISYEMANELIAKTIQQQSDYGYVNSGMIPIGLKVSIIKSEVLFMLNEMLIHPTYREHITLYIDEHLRKFKTTLLEPFEYMKHKNFRLTCDTNADYLFFETVVKELGDEILLPTEDILSYLDEEPQIVAINNSVKQNSFLVKKGL